MTRPSNAKCPFRAANIATAPSDPMPQAETRGIHASVRSTPYMHGTLVTEIKTCTDIHAHDRLICFNEHFPCSNSANATAPRSRMKQSKNERQSKHRRPSARETRTHPQNRCTLMQNALEGLRTAQLHHVPPYRNLKGNRAINKT
jgi:hypothetical protein